MVETFIYVVEGVNLEGDITPEIRRAAARAVNRATERARPRAGRMIREDVNLPARYLSGADGRLQMSKPASQRNLERTITGRRRATSLAQYSKRRVLTPKQQARVDGISVSVKPGVARFIKRGFLIRLRAGNSGALSNLGLAVRTDGGPPRGAFKPKKLADNLYLLYGLSVDVLFRRTIEPMTPEIQADMEAEVLRQIDLAGII